ncbi:MAG: hypothetical protein OEW73_11260 [Gammaproteobacteria bacterium]|nr:hypothetical protein [Gammaproteobacteria bacterium]MDH5241350.1 hypothetical protein [Gammaproteobacteria bacterium]MDH5583782.1 hypothetical protein [Gammaproteobacteria bacterium]
MRSITKVCVYGAVISISADVLAETPAEIFQEMDSRKRASFAGIENFSQMKTTMGMCSLEHFEKASTELADGSGSVEYMRLVPVSEAMERNSPESDFSNATPEDLDLAAAELRQQAPAMDQAMRNELHKAGLPGGLSYMLTNPPPGKPWLSPMPGDMMNNYAEMLEGAAEGKRQAAKQKTEAEEDAKTDALASIADATTIAGHENLHGRLAIHLVAEGLNYTQLANDQTFELNTLHLWVDAEKYVPLKLQMDGIASDGSELRPLQIIREDMAYETTPGCESLSLPLRTVMQVSGVLNAKEQAEMAEAQEKLAEFEQQMASMPASQRDMIMRQMGPQLEMFKNMASGGGIELVSLTTGMRCNAGVPSNEEYMQTVPGVSQSACIGFGGN